MPTSEARRNRKGPEISLLIRIQRTAIGSTVRRIDPTRAGGKAESEGTVPQTSPVSTMTVNDSTTGDSGRKPAQPSVPHSRPDIQEKAAASQAH
jgi:hypothetical protein